MNELKVEDMKALHAYRTNKLNSECRLSLVKTPKSERKIDFAAIRAAFSALRSFCTRSDLDFKAWHDLEFRNEREQGRDLRKYLNPWL